MEKVQSLAQKELADQIRESIMALLRSNSIYDLGSYGWLNADDADPDLIGHAMWQTDSLSFRLLDARMAAMQSKTAKFPELETWQRFLISVGGDFEGLMDTARLAIGLALFEREVGDTERFGGDSFFQLHLIAALVTLGAASDRLRDVFIAAIFHLRTKKYEGGDWKEKGDRKAYGTPFLEAVERLELISAAPASVAKLPTLAADIHWFRRARNTVVHDVATESGRLAHEMANSPRPSTYGEGLEMSYERMLEHASEYENRQAKRVAEEMEQPIKWYKLIIEMSNHVFIVENTLRRHTALTQRTN